MITNIMSQSHDPFIREMDEALVSLFAGKPFLKDEWQKGGNKTETRP